MQEYARCNGISEIGKVFGHKRMIQIHSLVELLVTVCCVVICFQLGYIPIFQKQPLPFNFHELNNISHHEDACHSVVPTDRNELQLCSRLTLLTWGTRTTQNSFGNGRRGYPPRPFQQDHGVRSAELIVKMTGQPGQCGPLSFCAEEAPLHSVAPAVGPWGQSLYDSISHLANTVQHRARSRRSSLTRYITGHVLPQIEGPAKPTAFKLEFKKCAQVDAGTEFPYLMFLLRIRNNGPTGGANLTQLAIRDSISGITPLQSGGMVVEKGFQTFTIDSLPAGSEYVVTYTALIKGHKTVVLDLPAFLTFSNASLNDVNMFGPVLANLTLRVNSTDKIYPNHGVHFAGFIGGFFLSMLLLALGFLAMKLICGKARKNSLQQRKKRGDSDPEYAVCNMSETVKEEAAFEDKMVDIMLLEDPQNMYQALENLEMSTLLRATSALESSRVHMYKDVIAALLAALRSQNHISQQAEQRLLSVLHGQLMGMEGKLKEEHVARMATLAAQCNLETREQMEAEHCRETQEKAQAEVLFQHAHQQELLQCSVLLEKLHELSQSRLQHSLLVKHEEVSARVQRHMVEWRRVELHKIFSEEVEEATRMGELEKTVARNLLHDYFTYQSQLEDVLDVILANQRCILGERHAQRRFLVHSLHSLKDLITDTFSQTSNQLDQTLSQTSSQLDQTLSQTSSQLDQTLSQTSSQLEIFFKQHRRGSDVSEELALEKAQKELVLEKAQKELALVKQRLDEALNRERRAMHCGLVKKRRDLISDMLQGHKQRHKELSALCRGTLCGGALEEGTVEVDPAQHLHCWQTLLITQSQELGELINNLDEEAAADIRKVTMRSIHSSMAEVKAIQAGAIQALLALGLQQPALESAIGAGSSALLQAQERLQLEGKGAVRTLQASRDALHKGLTRELQGQQELRARGRVFFRSLCSSQLTLSDEELLRMKLEFQKCLSRLDHCLVLPHALRRSKLQSALSCWRKQHEKQTEILQPAQKKMRPKRKSKESRQKAGCSELMNFQNKMEDTIKLFDKEREMENTLMEKVLEEIRSEREEELQRQAEGLAVQMTSLHYQKAERRSRVLETSKALLTVQSLIIEELREDRRLGSAPIAQIIQNHCRALEEAELQLQRAHSELECLEAGPTRTSQQTPPRDPDVDREEEEERRLFHIERGTRMATILHEAIDKRNQVIRLQTDRIQEANARSQAMEDLKDQLELKRLYMSCDQDLEFAARLVRQSQVSNEILLETLRLLLPTLPESELLSLINALCPKQPVPPGSAEQERPACPSRAGKYLLVRLRKEMVRRNMLSHTTEELPDQFQGKRQSLVERLFISPRPEAPREITPVLVQETGKQGVTSLAPQRPTPKPVATGNSRITALEQLQDSVQLSKGEVWVDSETVFDSTAAAPLSFANDAAVLEVPSAGERLSVFRAPPDPRSLVGATNHKRKKRNFLNQKKGSVSPMDHI